VAAGRGASNRPAGPLIQSSRSNVVEHCKRFRRPCYRGDGDRRAKRAHGGHGAGKSKIHAGGVEAAYRRTEGKRGCLAAQPETQ
jgi:hypothetical protein